MHRCSTFAAAAAMTLSLAIPAPAHASEPDPGIYALPSGDALFELRRWARHKEPLDHRTGPGTAYYDFVNEGPLGKAAHAPFAGSHALYSCRQSYKWYGQWAEDRFTSTDPGCEGKGADNPHFIGHVASTHIDGTAPLFRCFDDAGAMANHFDTLATNCEGKRTIGILGFVIL